MALKKVINSATQQFEPVLVDKLVLDAVPTVNSFNSVTSDAVARAVAGASGEVPAVTESDNGKVLKAVYDEGGAAVEWGEAAPAVTVDQTYNALSENPQSGTAVAGAIATVKQVPASTASDSSKVLTVNASGNPEWQTASSGGGVSILENGGLALYQDKAYVKTAEGKGVKLDSGNVVADFDVVQPCLTLGSDFYFDRAIQYYSNVSHDDTWVEITYNDASKFTLPGSLPQYVYSSFGGRLELQIVDSNGTKLTTVKTKTYGGTSMLIPEEMYKNVSIPAGNQGNYLRWQAITNAMYPYSPTETTWTISNFSTTTPCFSVPYSGTLMVNFPATPKIIFNAKDFGQQHPTYGYFSVYDSTRLDAGVYSVTIYGPVPAGTTKAVVNVSTEGSYTAPITNTPSTLPSGFAGTSSSVIQFTASLSTRTTNSVYVAFYDSSDAIIDSTGWGSLAVPKITLVKIA